VVAAAPEGDAAGVGLGGAAAAEVGGGGEACVGTGGADVGGGRATAGGDVWVGTGVGVGGPASVRDGRPDGLGGGFGDSASRLSAMDGPSEGRLLGNVGRFPLELHAVGPRSAAVTKAARSIRDEAMSGS
jgi:hypothetical protein